MFVNKTRATVIAFLTLGWLAVDSGSQALADGMVVGPKEYKGSLAERSQEALIVFHPGDEKRSAAEDLILKIRVEGAVESFAWVLALPNVPTTAPEDPKLFEELHRYVETQKSRSRPKPAPGVKSPVTSAIGSAEGGVEVVSRKDVGRFDVAIVREKEAGALNGWLTENGYRRVEAADDVIEFYRKKSYVFACVRITDAALKSGSVDLHPLRFSFETGGRDSVYFPMRLTGLQAKPFDVNLYVLYNKWLNDRINGYGYVHRGFALNWRDYDSRDCEPNAGKRWSDPSADPYLGPVANLIPTVTKLCQKLHPGERYYLTNLEAFGLIPRDVRDWPDDLWLFPYYTDAGMVPLDAREGGPASGAYRHMIDTGPVPESRGASRRFSTMRSGLLVALVVLIVVTSVVAARRPRLRSKAAPRETLDIE